MGHRGAALTFATSSPSWVGLQVCVAGSRVVGGAAARLLLERGATVTVLDENDDDTVRQRAVALEHAGARVLLGSAAVLPPDAQLLVVSAGFPPGAPVLVAARRAGIPVWGDVELALRVREGTDTGNRVGQAPALLCITGTNGKTTTTRMLESMLTAAGLRTVACGNVGLPVFEAVTGAYDVLAVELSSFQLHYQRAFGGTLGADAAAVLNLATDHLDWHGSFEEYSADKGRIFAGARLARVVNADDGATVELAVGSGAPVVPFGSGPPTEHGYGVCDGTLVGPGGVELAAVEDVRPGGAHNVGNALAAAALAKAYGVPDTAVREGLRAFEPNTHQVEVVAELGDLTWVDDSKATNAAAARADLLGMGGGARDIVWIAGGLTKGGNFEDLVAAVESRLLAVVLIGADRAPLAGSLRRHAPEVPVFEVPSGDAGPVTGDDVMRQAVSTAAAVARRGTTVVLAPACASMDQFRDYAHRGQAFAAAVRRLGEAT